MRLLGRVFVLAAFWVPLAICMAVAITPDPIGVVAGLSGWIAHICAFAYLTAALFQAHFRWHRGSSSAAAVASTLAGASSSSSSSDVSPATAADSAGRTTGDSDASASPARCVFAAVLWMLAFGVVIEVAQLFVAGRSGELADLLPDAAGITLGCVVQSVWPRAARTVVERGR